MKFAKRQYLLRLRGVGSRLNRKSPGGKVPPVMGTMNGFSLICTVAGILVEAGRVEGPIGVLPLGEFFEGGLGRVGDPPRGDQVWK